MMKNKARVIFPAALKSHQVNPCVAMETKQPVYCQQAGKVCNNVFHCGGKKDGTCIICFIEVLKY